MRIFFAIRLSSSSLSRLLRHASVSASSATSRPILFLKRKQSATVREAVDANGLSLDAMLLDSKIEHGWRDVDDSEWRRRKTRHARAARNGNPDLGRKLSSDVMEAESGNKANHRTRDGGSGDGEIMVLGRPYRPGQTIASWPDPFERTGPRHSSQRASVDALMSYVAGAQNGLLLGKTQKVARGASLSRHFAGTC